MARTANDSFATPQPVSVLAKPARVYITVSRSEQMRKPQRSKSSAVFTTTERSPGESTTWSPAASFAPPTPPARAHTLTIFHRRSSVSRFDQLQRSLFVGRTFKHMTHYGHKAECVRDLSTERHS